MIKKDRDQPIRLLHLSDIHFRAGTAWDANPLLRDLAGFIGRQVRGQGLVPDLVVVTFDLAYSGIADEYALARAWLNDQLWPRLTPDGSPKLPRDRLLLVPGNHDVDRTRVSKGARRNQTGLLAERSQQAIAELFEDEDDRALMLKRHAAYQSFHAGWLGTSQPLPWWQRTLEIRGQRPHVAGLDSAWMACGDDDRGRLLHSR